MQPKRVLVTGASGDIGSAISDHLAQQGVAVTAFSLSGPFPAGADRVVEGDASEPGAVLAAMRNVDAVVHLAAIPHPDLDVPETVFATNVISTFRVLAAAGASGVSRAVLASSLHAYGAPLNRHQPMPAYFPLDEQLPRDIEDAYSLSKSADEATARMAWRRWGVDTVALRFPLVKSWEVLRSQLDVYAADPAQNVRLGWGYLDRRDAVQAIYLALTAPLSGAHVIGLSAADTMIDLPTAGLLEQFAPGVPIRTPIIGRSSAIDTSIARTVLGFEPAFSVHETVQPAAESLPR